MPRNEDDGRPTWTAAALGGTRTTCGHAPVREDGRRHATMPVVSHHRCARSARRPTLQGHPSSPTWTAAALGGTRTNPSPRTRPRGRPAERPVPGGWRSVATAFGTGALGRHGGRPSRARRCHGTRTTAARPGPPPPSAAPAPPAATHPSARTAGGTPRCRWFHTTGAPGRHEGRPSRATRAARPGPPPPSAAPAPTPRPAPVREDGRRNATLPVVSHHRTYPTPT